MRLIDADALITLIKKRLKNELIIRWLCGLIAETPTIEARPVVRGEWEDGRCSNCHAEAFSTSWDEPIYDYDWEENLRYSHTERHTEYHETDFCHNCGAEMRSKEEE